MKCYLSTHLYQNFANQDREDCADTCKDDDCNEELRHYGKEDEREADQVHDGMQNGEEKVETISCKACHIFLDTLVRVIHLFLSIIVVPS